MKLCSGCETLKEESEFAKDKYAPGGIRAVCKTCRNAYTKRYYQNNKMSRRAEQKARREANPVKHRGIVRKSELKIKYGIAVAEYDSLLSAQNGVCAICKQADPAGMQLAVDHVHGSNPPIVRGLLCCNCNRAVGLLQDSQENFLSGAYYLTPQKLTPPD